MTFTVKTPNRVDFAGGSTDIHPLCLLMDGGYTVNAAITVFSSAEFRTEGVQGIRVISEDLGVSIRSDSPETLPLDGLLGLPARAIRAFPPPIPVEIRTRNQAPAGSGLGASSALLTALLHGLALMRGEELSPDALICLAADIETASIGVPAGKQDYTAAFFGGVSLLSFNFGGFSREGIEPSSNIVEELSARLIVSFTGENRFSGANNWELTKSFIDRRGSVREALIKIRDTALEAGRRLREGRIDEFADAVRRDWDLRRSLAPGISTPKTDRLIAKAREAGAAASKLCGAGGGGCMLSLAPPRKKSAVEAALVGEGATLLGASICRTGLVLEQC
jgi:D-glycero-alpha-D-manno-heptose-7-phosphate kinase